MYKDDIIEEVRAAREAYARRFNYDIDAIIKDVQKREPHSGHPVVRLKARRIKPVKIEFLPDDESETNNKDADASICK